MSSSDMSCTPNCMYDSHMYNSQQCETSEIGSNPLQVAEVRRAAEQAVKSSVDAIKKAGGNVCSPEFLAKKEEIVQQFTDEILKQAMQNVRNLAGSEKSKKAETGDAACDGGSSVSEGSELSVGAGGGSIFEKIALALGTAMEDKIKQLLQAAENVKSADEEGLLLASAQVTARGQELNVLSQAFNSTINSVGQAGSTAARKQ